MKILLFLLSVFQINGFALWWPFSSSSSSVEESIMTLPSSSSMEGRNSKCGERRRRFQAPFPVTTDTSQLFLNSKEVGCRYHLAKTLIESGESCGKESMVKEFSRIATICHYQVSGRINRLPSHCFDETCIPELSEEVFAIYTAFHLHAERICRELSSEAWRKSIEEMVTNLGLVADDALDRFNIILDESLEFFNKQEASARELGSLMNSLKKGQEDHINTESEHHRRTISYFQTQETHLANLKIKMQNFTDAFTGFVSDSLSYSIHQY